MKTFFCREHLAFGSKIENMRLNSSEDFSFFFRDHHDFRTKFVLGLRILLVDFISVTSFYSLKIGQKNGV